MSTEFSRATTTHRLIHGDARHLDFIPDGSVHLVVTSPPYWILKRYNENPSMFSEQRYVAAKVISIALKEIGGEVGNKEAFLAALRKVAFLAPRGPISFDENQNVVENVYIRKVFLVKGKMLNIVMDFVPKVDQNWSPR